MCWNFNLRFVPQSFTQRAQRLSGSIEATSHEHIRKRRKSSDQNSSQCAIIIKNHALSTKRCFNDVPGCGLFVFFENLPSGFSKCVKGDGWVRVPAILSVIWFIFSQQCPAPAQHCASKRRHAGASTH